MDYIVTVNAEWLWLYHFPLGSYLYKNTPLILSVTNHCRFPFIPGSLHLPWSLLLCWACVVSTGASVWHNGFAWSIHPCGLLIFTDSSFVHTSHTFYHHSLNLTSQKMESLLVSSVKWSTFMYKITKYLLRTYGMFICNNERKLYFGCYRMLFWPQRWQL